VNEAARRNALLLVLATAGVLALFVAGLWLGGRQQTVATVHGARISKVAVEVACLEAPPCDPERPATVEPVIDRLVREAVIEHAGAERGLPAPTDAEVAKRVFEQFRTPEGRFDEVAHQADVAASGVRRVEYDQRWFRRLAAERLDAALRAEGHDPTVWMDGQLRSEAVVRRPWNRR
jgi:hypothetical protein